MMKITDRSYCPRVMGVKECVVIAGQQRYRCFFHYDSSQASHLSHTMGCLEELNVKNSLSCSHQDSFPSCHLLEISFCSSCKQITISLKQLKIWSCVCTSTGICEIKFLSSPPIASFLQFSFSCF